MSVTYNNCLVDDLSFAALSCRGAGELLHRLPDLSACKAWPVRDTHHTKTSNLRYHKHGNSPISVCSDSELRPGVCSAGNISQSAGTSVGQHV